MNEADMDRFLYFTIFLKNMIPSRTQHAQIMKEAVILEDIPVFDEEGNKTKKRKTKRSVDYVWGERQEQSFQAIKHAIINNVMVSSNAQGSYYPATDALAHGLGGVLFQLDNNFENESQSLNYKQLLMKKGKVADMRAALTKQVHKYPQDRERVITFISQRFSDTERRYPTTE